MNTDQIAAELENDLARESKRPERIALIRAAIEKAQEPVRKFWKDTYDTCYATLHAERAAHASEQPSEPQKAAYAKGFNDAINQRVESAMLPEIRPTYCKCDNTEGDNPDCPIHLSQ